MFIVIRLFVVVLYFRLACNGSRLGRRGCHQTIIDLFL